MTTFAQKITDARMIVRSDRRVWSATGFLLFVALVWVLTSTWREPPLTPQPYKKKEKPVTENMDQIIANFHRQIQENKKSRDEFRETLTRTVNDIDTDKQKIDWHVNTLVDKLNAMTMRVDKLVQDVGMRKIEDGKLEERLKQFKKKGRGIKHRIDRSDL